MAKVTAEGERALAPGKITGAEVVGIVVILVLLGGTVYFLSRGGSPAVRLPEEHRLVDVKTITGTRGELCGLPSLDGKPVVVGMIYSNDKQAWVEHASNRFSRLCPNIQVKLTAMGDIEAADAILAGGQEHSVFSPADDLVLRYLDRRWEERSGDVLFRIEEQISLVRSPLVVLVWEDRLRVMDAIIAAGDRSEGPWMQAACPLVPRDPGSVEVAPEDMVPGRWIDWYAPLLRKDEPKKRPGPAAKKEPPPPPSYQAPFPTEDEIRRWGRVKFAHTSPTRSASGLEALYLMAFDYVLPPGERAPRPVGEEASAPAEGRHEGEVIGSEHLREDFEHAFAERKDSLRRWLRRCEGGLDATPKSARLLTQTMFNVGGTRYDGVLTYEHLTFEVLQQIDGYSSVMSSMRVLYPQPTIVNHHPVVLLYPDDPSRAEQHEAAQRWVAFLRSEEMQLAAIERGFRPGNPEVLIRAHDVEGNPFLHLRRYGVDFDPTLREPPRAEGELIAELIDIWRVATGRN